VRSELLSGAILTGTGWVVCVWRGRTRHVVTNGDGTPLIYPTKARAKENMPMLKDLYHADAADVERVRYCVERYTVEDRP
jgi:hypothetical protein